MHGSIHEGGAASFGGLGIGERLPGAGPKHKRSKSDDGGLKATDSDSPARFSGVREAFVQDCENARYSRRIGSSVEARVVAEATAQLASNVLDTGRAIGGFVVPKRPSRFSLIVFRPRAGTLSYFEQTGNALVNRPNDFVQRAKLISELVGERLDFGGFSRAVNADARAVRLLP
jgi:hypothetical protein